MDVRALMFDFGGVLYMPPDLKNLQRWEKILGLKKDGYLKEFFAQPGESQFAQKVFTGEISEAEILNNLGLHWRISPWLVRFLRKRSFSKKRFNHPMADYIRSLRPRYLTAILSNAGDLDRQVFNEAYGIEALVDKVIISAEVGLAKPDPRIYWLALDQFGLQPEETIFVDDLAINVEAAKDLRMRAIQFHSNKQVFREIQEMLGA
jgi:epoxide hydrolase-like predicted phosphatase